MLSFEAISWRTAAISETAKNFIWNRLKPHMFVVQFMKQCVTHASKDSKRLGVDQFIQG